MNKTVYIIRGPSGSGKTTLAKQLCAENNIFETDQYFTHNGVYEFDPSDLMYAHADCFARFQIAVLEGRGPLAVSNTSTRLHEYFRYGQLAKEHGYRVVEIICGMSLSARELQKLCTHAVPLHTIENQIRRFER